jgi:DNA polymerase sigma
MVYAFVTKNILEIQTGNDSARQIHKFNFGVLFKDFFKFYGYKIDYDEIIIKPNGRQFNINKKEFFKYQNILNLEKAENIASNYNYGYNVDL